MEDVSHKGGAFMKFSIVKNDKSTYWDEVILFLMIAISIAIGVCLLIFKPSFWIIQQNDATLIGVMFIIFGVMYIPGLIYRLFTNDKK